MATNCNECQWTLTCVKYSGLCDTYYCINPCSSLLSSSDRSMKVMLQPVFVKMNNEEGKVVLSRVVDNIFVSSTQSSKVCNFRLVREPFNRNILGIMTLSSGKNKAPIVTVNKNTSRGQGLLYFDIVLKLTTIEEYQSWVKSHEDSDRWGCIHYGGQYGSWVYDKYTSPAEFVNHHKKENKRCLTISNPSVLWKGQKKV